jgi:hypothetical protein
MVARASILAGNTVTRIVASIATVNEMKLRLTIISQSTLVGFPAIKISKRLREKRAKNLHEGSGWYDIVLGLRCRMDDKSIVSGSAKVRL